MALSTSDHPVLDPNQNIYRPTDAWEKRAPTASKTKALDASMRRMESQVDGTKQRVALMGRMIADFGGMAAELDRQILIEQERAGVHDPAHFAYPIYANAAALRRDNLKHSADELRAQLAKAKEVLLGLGVAA